MRDISLKELLEAGCHFGHVVTRQNSKAREFIFETRENVNIIDLAKTREGLLAAAEFIQDLAKKGGTIIFVGTKRQAQEIIAEEAKKAQVFYVNRRWIGGTISNFEEVSKNFQKLKELEEKLANDKEKEGYTKREIGLWEKEKAKLAELYGGIYQLEHIPDALFLADVHEEESAVREAAKRGVILVGVVDTNADPTSIDYPIPSNDDAIGAIKLIVSYLADAWIEGKKTGIKDQEAIIKKIKSEEAKNKKKTVKGAKSKKLNL